MEVADKIVNAPRDGRDNPNERIDMKVRVVEPDAERALAEPIETEIKLKVASAEAARESAARASGAELVRARHFEDNVLFDDEAGSLRAQRHRAAPARAPRRRC